MIVELRTHLVRYQFDRYGARLTERTYRPPPMHTTQMVTDLRSMPLLRSEAICNSSAVPILLSSSLVQVVMSTHAYYSNILHGKDQGANLSLK